MWTQALQNVWSRTFHLATLAFPLLVISALWILRPREFDLRVYLLSWAFAAPIGFLLWVFAWKIYGAGTGRVTFPVTATAIVGWCVWNRGVYLTFIERRFHSGTIFCLATMLALYCAKAVIGTGVGPLKLVFTAALIQVGIPLTIAVAIGANRLLRITGKKFGIPIWKFLTQPVTIRKWSTVHEAQGSHSK